MSFLDNTGLSYFYGKLKEKFIRSVSAGGDTLTPDASGNVAITNVATADNLTSPDAQTYYADFIYRTSGGNASLSSGEANLVYVDGNMSISGRVAENFVITATNGIAVTYSASVWRNQISASGNYEFSYTKPTSSSSTTSWTATGVWSYGGSEISMDTYGLYVSNVTNPNISIAVSGSGVTAATVVPNTWATQILNDGTYEFIYDGSNWTLDETDVTLSTYGIVTTGTAISNDAITVTYIAGTSNSTVTVVYTAPEQGTISIPTPTGFSATGFNQFDNSTMYIADATISGGVVASSSGSYLCYCRAVGGVTNGYVAYSSGGYITNIGWCATLPVVGTAVDQTTTSVATTLSSVEFDDDGYVVVVVSDMSDLCVHPKWSGSADEEYAAYVEPSTIAFPTVDTSNVTIPIGDYGMPAVGSVADRLNLDAGTYIQRIGRLANTSSNMDYVTGLGTDYEYDSSYIYYVLTNPVTYLVDIDPTYTVNDWGTEEFLGTSVALYAQTLYGQNLRDKLRTDVLTISEQNPALTANELETVYSNLHLNSFHLSGTITSFPFTIEDERISARSSVVNVVLGTPASVTSDLIWSTDEGIVTIRGVLASSSSTTIEFDIAPTITASETIISNKPKQFSLIYGSMVTNVANEYCYVCGNMVSIALNLTISATTAKSIQGLFTVPAGYLPLGGVYFAGIDNTNDMMLNCSIGSGGGCNVYRAHTTSMTSIRLTVAYPIN